MAQPARQTVGVARMLGLFVFVATAALFAGGAVNVLLGGLDVQFAVATAFAYLVAAVAAGAMLIDCYDLWVLGRRMSEKTVRNLRRTVLIAMLGSLASIMLTRNLSLVVLIGPSLILYYAVTRKPAGTGSGVGRPAAGGGSRPAGAPKARQRRGGRKRR